jgi:ADP-ribosylglycohydrolase
MRISPLGIWGVNESEDDLADLAVADAMMTHRHSVCQQINVIYVLAIRYAVKTKCSPKELYKHIRVIASDRGASDTLLKTIHDAAHWKPLDYCHNQGWVMIAFKNALFQLWNADSFEEALVDTVMQGGDTDTNAAICGALIGAVYGIDAIPQQWRDAVLSCRPSSDNPRAHRPRPEEYWPIDALELAEALLLRSDGG